MFLFEKDQKDSDTPTVISTPLPNNIVNDNSYTGSYVYNGMMIYVYQNTKDVIYFTFNPYIYGKAVLNNNKYTGFRSISNDKINYSFSLSDNILTIESDNALLPKGEYEKSGNVTINKLFNVAFGESARFDSKYNGKYVKKNISMYIYEAYEDKVHVIVNSDSVTLNATFDIQSDSSILVSEDNMNKIIFRDNTITFETNDPFYSNLVGDYKKEKKVTMQDIIENDIFYY